MKTVPIYPTSAQTLRNVYFSIIADYLEFFKSLLGVTEVWNIYLSVVFVVIFENLRDLVRKVFVVFDLLIANKSFE